MNEFRYVSYAQQVIFEPGAVSHLAESLHALGWKRLMVCTSRSMRSNGQLAVLEAALGEGLVAVYDRVEPHVQDIQVEEVLQIALEKEVQALIGMGGGSPIGMAKAAAAALDERQNRSPAPPIPVVAIPTTYAGSEMTPVYGVTHTREDPPRKVTIYNPDITPRLVIYDPELTLDLPAELTASTGVNALAHCIEALYSTTRNPLSTAAATSGVQHLFNALFRCYENGKDRGARSAMLLGAHLAGFSLASVTMGLHHGLCHVLGGSAGVPHGIANSIILPHAIRFNADLTASQLLPAAEAMGVPVDGDDPKLVIETMAEKIQELIARMNLPQRLRQAGVEEPDLPRLAQLAFQNRTVQNNPTPITHVGPIERLLREAW